MEKMATLALQGERREDIEGKNRFIREHAEEWLAFSNAEKLSEAELQQMFEENALDSYGEVIVFCAGQSQEALQLPLEDVLQCFALQIVGLAFRRNILEYTGGYNTKLQALQDYELVCRLTEHAGSCLFVFTGAEEDELVIAEEELQTYAYLLRRYLLYLQKKGQMENVLQGMYHLADNAGRKLAFQAYLNDFLAREAEYEKIEAVTAPFLIFRGEDTCYGVMRKFADCLAGELRRMGQGVIMLESGKLDFDYLSGHVFKAIIGFQAVAMGNDFFKKLHGIKMQLWVDSPVQFRQHFEQLPEECYILCHDANYLEFIRKYYHRRNTVQFPPGGYVPKSQKPMETQSSRPYDIVFIGSFYPPDQELEGDWQEAFYQYMLAHPGMTFGEGLRGMCAERGIHIEEAEFPEKLLALKPASHKVINYYKKRVIDTILEAGYELHVYGDTWEVYSSPWMHKLVRHPAVTMEEALLEWQKAKIGLNIMSWHKGGMTERVANIMLAGAVCLSDETEYLRSHFKDGEEILCYQLEHLEKLPAMIAAVLENEEYRKIGRRGQEIALREHTWERRAEQILYLTEEIWNKKYK